ncbi:hypothetical protein A3J56_01610 [Candidatus Giovannonibacteria bacterium RIFCSPHIGHO2_02_FULL_46_20]|uniref:DUF3307 domain-containing protein n=1 Tax=Candidatus Giovannonibacteria bacterium RIFCSPHIGHO2_02_FULL_46_20 TaxID=1798338 RepID=A0A1F5WHQ4_9BACT|nr:MAG: hypothetical protein A3J56_01610 [Candidatus Giovannonibacteria bacterium RIFCSPHIGHO2_02_FULL_46_20]
MFAQFVCHLVGDYVLQSGWMANNKTQGWFPAFVHAIAYFLPFLLVFYPSMMASTVIAGTHFLIDRFRLAKYVAYANHFLSPRSEWKPWCECSVTGYHKNTPPFLAVRLMIIVDNTMHLIINAAALAYL